MHIIATLHVFFPGFPLTSTWIQRPAGHFPARPSRWLESRRQATLVTCRAMHQDAWWVHPHILPGPSKHKDFPIDQCQPEIGNAVFLIYAYHFLTNLRYVYDRICTLQYCHTCFFSGFPLACTWFGQFRSCFFYVFSCSRSGQVADWNTGAEGGLDDWLFWHQWLHARYPLVI